MSSVKTFFDENYILYLLKKTQKPSAERILKILKKAGKKKGLNLEEVGWLINAEEPELIEKIFKTAGQIKKEIYGERLVLFAPLYVSNFCVNDCAYCGFHCSNPSPRKKLTLDEIREQVKILEDMGHKRLLLEFGEHPQENPIDYVVEVIKTIYATKNRQGEIRRVNVNIAATTIENYQKLKKAGIGTYQLFQETYHQPTYEKLHKGPKSDFERQLFAHDRALKAGLDDIGLGVLFGLYDYKFEVLSLVSHAQYLDKKYGIGPHTFSVPRWQPAPTVHWQSAPYPVSEGQLLKIIAVLRLAVPYTGMIISTRERPEMRNRAFKIGISQTSSGSRTWPGGYNKNSKIKAQNSKLENPQSNPFGMLRGRQKSKIIIKQFELADQRSVEEFMADILKQNLLPSFCTACYRSGRTGQSFMNLAKPGEIQKFCRPNALLTFKEYLEDYADEKIKKLGASVLNYYLNKITDPFIKKETLVRLQRIENKERDLYF